MYTTDLKNINIIENVSNEVIDGINIINLFKPTTDLGKLLDPFSISNKKIKFLKYGFFSTKSLMDFLRFEGYKEEWLGMKIHKKSLRQEIKNLPSKHIESYWGIITLFLIQKVKHNKDLRHMLKYNEIPFGMYKDEVKEVMLFGKKFKMKAKMNEFHNYCKIITLISNIIKNNNFDNDNLVRNILRNNFPTLEKDIDILIK